MVAVSDAEQNKIDRLQDRANEGETPHGTRRQASEENKPQRESSAQNNLPTHRDIFFVRVLKQKIPCCVHGRGNEKQNEGGNWHELFHELDQFLIHLLAGIVLHPMRGPVKECQCTLVAQINGGLRHFGAERNIALSP